MIRNREVRDRERRKMTRRKFGFGLAAAVMGSKVLHAADPDYTIVVVPDTQYLNFYCSSNLRMDRMIQWIVDNQSANQGGVFTMNVKAVVGVGDCTQFGSAGEFTTAQRAYKLLDDAG